MRVQPTRWDTKNKHGEATMTLNDNNNNNHK